MPEPNKANCIVAGIDHLVLTVADLRKTISFYTRVLGMDVIRFGEGRVALTFGSQKINLHEAGREFEPKARRPLPGSADLCFVANRPLGEIVRHLAAQNVELEEGPVDRNGALGPIRSVYLRDPDGNLVEIASYDRC